MPNACKSGALPDRQIYSEHVAPWDSIAQTDVFVQRIYKQADRLIVLFRHTCLCMCTSKPHRRKRIRPLACATASASVSGAEEQRLTVDLNSILSVETQGILTEACGDRSPPPRGRGRN